MKEIAVKAFLAAAVLLSPAATACFAQTGPAGSGTEQEKPALKIGFADVKTIIEKYARSQTLESEIDRFREEETDKIEAKKKELQAKRDELKALAPDSALGVQTFKEMRRLDLDVKFMEEQLNADINVKLLRATRDVYVDVSGEIEAYAKKNGYVVIFKVDTGEMPSESKSELIVKINLRGVLYYDKSLDISQDIIDILNEKYTGKKPEEKKPAEGADKKEEKPADKPGDGSSK